MTEFGWIIPIVKMYSGILQILMLYSFTPTHNPRSTLSSPSDVRFSPPARQAPPSPSPLVPRSISLSHAMSDVRTMSVLSLTMSVMSDVCAMSDVHTMS